ncbi:hypothetical protein I6A84_42880 [Frankia sp. CNm7]|nr:hypothetical protein [Frankia nepalensis]
MTAQGSGGAAHHPAHPTHGRTVETMTRLAVLSDIHGSTRALRTGRVPTTSQTTP